MARYCDSFTRREFLKIGALGLAGLGTADLLLHAAHTDPCAPARAVILLWMDGGPPQHETFDPKPNAASEVRGAFGAIPTNVAGVRIGELMPRMAKQMDKVALVRTLSHTEITHEGAAYLLLTGRRPDPGLVPPSIGSVTAKVLGSRGPLPPYVAVPDGGFGFGHGRGGCLGTAFAPLSACGHPYGDTLHSPEIKVAFDLDQEPERLRDAYGCTAIGQSCLLARRLVEAGARFVTVSHGGWDTHSDHFEACRRELIPPMDQAFAALLSDLHDRGLLATTLVVWMGEFGRSPQINTLAGRDHWPWSGCAVFAGAGVRGGQVIGQTDALGAYPKERPVSPADVACTIYHKLGIDPRRTLSALDRPLPILTDGELIRELV